MRKFIVSIMICILFLMPKTILASEKVTPYSPEVKSTPAITIEGEKGKGWLWIILGVLAAGGVAALAGGGGGGGGGGSSGGGTGSVVINY